MTILDMRYWLLLILLSASAWADQSTPITPGNQNLSVVDYFSNGQQTGCGLRATGETPDNLWLNILVTVFRKETGATFGVIKVVARKVITKDGAPVLENGHIRYADIGNIRRAWIRPDSGKEARISKNGGPMHNDAYMADSEFSSTVALLIAMSQEKFRVGISWNESDPDKLFEFNKKLDPGDADKLAMCMNNLRASIEDNKKKQSF